MARPTNKLERKLSNKNRLRRLYYSNGHNTRNSKVTFILKSDSKDNRQTIIYDEAKGVFLTWELPSVEYTMVEYTKSIPCSKYYKRYSNRVVRHTKEIYKGNQYRKVFDYWWTID